MIRLLSLGLLVGLCGCLGTGEPVQEMTVEGSQAAAERNGTREPLQEMTVEGFRAAAERNGTLATLDLTNPPNFVFVLFGPGENDLQVHTTKGDVPNAKRVYRYIDSAPIDQDGNRFVRHSYECGEYEVFVLSDIEALPPEAMRMMHIEGEDLPFCVVQFKNPRGLFPFPLQRSEHSPEEGEAGDDT